MSAHAGLHGRSIGAHYPLTILAFGDGTRAVFNCCTGQQGTRRATYAEAWIDLQNLRDNSEDEAPRVISDAAENLQRMYCGVTKRAPVISEFAAWHEQVQFFRDTRTLGPVICAHINKGGTS